MAHEITDMQDSVQFVYELYEKMKEYDVNLAYEGEITHQITKAFISLTETNMAKEEDNNSVQRKVFHVMVECLQNISKHADDARNCIINDEQVKDGRGIFMVSRGEAEYKVTSGNVIKNDKVEGLKKMLNYINSLDKEGLKKLYKLQIREGRLSEKEGAGLGFIDIARKTGEKLVFNFLPLNEDSSFFVLISTISRSK